MRLGKKNKRARRPQRYAMTQQPALERRYQPAGSAVLQQLDSSYLDLTLQDCDSVSNFAEKLRQARSEIEGLDKGLKIPEPLFVNHFLRGLGPEFATFLSLFHQLYSLLPTRDADGIITKEGVQFNHAVMLAEREEANLKLQQLIVAK